jgi:hypothetical protein
MGCSGWRQDASATAATAAITTEAQRAQRKHTHPGDAAVAVSNNNQALKCFLETTLGKFLQSVAVLCVLCASVVKALAV